ncbi:MAG TPA: histidine phosphatase family protein, partial [Bacteroidia bacterium]|nr:histidine phosphatase family protein [Bacteroidia bacterium]
KNTGFDKIYISGLRRTYQSVQRFINELNIPYEKLDALNEIRWGIYEGQQNSGEWKADYYKMIDEWAKGNLEHRVPNGENPLELQARQKPALEHILSQQQEETVLVCMHGRAMKSFLCLMTNEPLHNMEIFSHQNLGLYIVAYDGTDFEIKTQNCGKHLQLTPGYIV